MLNLERHEAPRKGRPHQGGEKLKGKGEEETFVVSLKLSSLRSEVTSLRTLRQASHTLVLVCAPKGAMNATL